MEDLNFTQFLPFEEVVPAFVVRAVNNVCARRHLLWEPLPQSVPIHRTFDNEPDSQMYNLVGMNEPLLALSCRTLPDAQVYPRRIRHVIALDEAFHDTCDAWSHRQLLCRMAFGVAFCSAKVW